MYYYGNDGTWNHGVKSFLPTGWVGLAESTNGIDWIKVDPPPNNDNDINLKKGSVFGPSADVNEWDSIHVGVGDVVRLPNGELHMYYFGGSNEKVSFGPGGGPVGGAAAPPASIQGLRMRIGRARSLDNGRTWERMGAAVLDHDDEEGIFASWPRLILPLDDDEILSNKKKKNKLDTNKYELMQIFIFIHKHTHAHIHTSIIFNNKFGEIHLNFVILLCNSLDSMKIVCID